MSGLNNFFRQTVALQLFHGGGPGGVAVMPSYPLTYVSLLTTLPASDGNGASINSPTDDVEWSVVRRQMGTYFGGLATRWSQPTSLGDNVLLSNLDEVTWTLAELSTLGPNIEVLGVAVYSHPSNKTLIAWDVLDDPFTAVATNEYTFQPGALKIRQQGVNK